MSPFSVNEPLDIIDYKPRFTTDSQERKTFPVASGVMDYFPDALMAIAEISFLGNQKHNPGEPLHWNRDKSTDQADALIRHFLERGTRDKDGKRHSARMAWRALALLQEEIERDRGLSPSRGSTSNAQRVAEAERIHYGLAQSGQVREQMDPVSFGTGSRGLEPGHVTYVDRLDGRK